MGHVVLQVFFKSPTIVQVSYMSLSSAIFNLLPLFSYYALTFLLLGFLALLVLWLVLWVLWILFVLLVSLVLLVLYVLMVLVVLLLKVVQGSNAL